MSADDNLRDALIEAFKRATEGGPNYESPLRSDAGEPLVWWRDEEFNHEFAAEIALRVIKDWTADEPKLNS